MTYSIRGVILKNFSIYYFLFTLSNTPLKNFIPICPASCPRFCAPIPEKNFNIWKLSSLLDKDLSMDGGVNALLELK